MSKGDLVMFTSTGSYARWFFGRMAIIEHVSTKGPLDDKDKMCLRVRWLEPVQYYDRHAHVSDFPAGHFEVC